jgi:hypothetical protein
MRLVPARSSRTDIPREESRSSVSSRSPSFTEHSPFSVPATSNRPSDELTTVNVMAVPLAPRRYSDGVMPGPVGRRSYTRLLDPYPAS